MAAGDGVILVGGEALFDLVADRRRRARPAHPGGGPFNAARTIGRLEQPVAYLGRLSTDRFGNRLAAILAEDGVGLEAVVRTDEPTTLALAEFNERGDASYRFYTERTSASGLSTESALAALPARRRRRCSWARSASSSSRWPRPWRPSSSISPATRWWRSTPTAARRSSTTPRATARASRG